MEQTGIIVKGVGGAYEVQCDSGRYTCTPRGIFRNRNTTPMVGDKVGIAITNPEKMLGTLHTILPRDNQLIRPAVANIGQVVITVTLAQPSFNPGLLDRFIVLAGYQNIPVLICINKADMHPPTPGEFAPYVAAGYPLVYTSTLTPEGIAPLRQHMAGKTNVFAGPSGVGKSSIINALLPQLALETGGLSTKLDRGKHTTRHSEIFALGQGVEDGFCVDTPGFTSLDIAHIDKQELGHLFLEFEDLIPECKFNNCLHHQEKNCAVKDAVGGAISPLRYDSYIKMLKTL